VVGKLSGPKTDDRWSAGIRKVQSGAPEPIKKRHRHSPTQEVFVVRLVRSLASMWRLGDSSQSRLQEMLVHAGIREKGGVEAGVRYLKSSFWPGRRVGSLHELDAAYAGWRDGIANARVHASRRARVADRLQEEQGALRPLPPGGFDPAGERTSRVPSDGYLKLCGAFYRAPERLVHQRVVLRFSRDEVWITHQGAEVARYPRSHEQEVWIPPAIPHPEPPPAPEPAVIQVGVTPPELADYAALIA
jgi:hypothetical protein